MIFMFQAVMPDTYAKSIKGPSRLNSATSDLHSGDSNCSGGDPYLLVVKALAKIIDFYSGWFVGNFSLYG